MNIPRSQIKRIERTEPPPKTAQKEAWESGNILSAQHAPKAHADLATEFRKLMRSRNAALDSEYMMIFYEQEIRKFKARGKRLGAEVTALNHELAKISEQTAAIKLPERAPSRNSDIQEYNKLIMQKQKLRDQGHVLFARITPLETQRVKTWEKIPELKAKYKLCRQPIALYKQDLQHFFQLYDPRKKKLPQDPDAPTVALFEKIDRYLTRFKQEMATVLIKPQQIGNTLIVQALVNGTTLGEFIFDTGATTMTISESFAKKLGIRIEVLPESEAVVADGRVIKVKSTLLASVSVGDSEAHNVEVLVISDSSNNPEDGLLGMSFLKHFIVGINGTTGEIELTQFLPN